MMGRAAMIDGILTSLDRATVGVLDRGFLYGDSIFETLRTYDGSPFALESHLSRLERSAALVHIDLPVPRDVLAREVIDAVRATRNPESYIRVMVTRGSGDLGLLPEPGLRPLRIVIVTPLVTPPERLYEQGIATITYAAARVTDATEARGAKVANYLVAVLALRAAQSAGAMEALITDAQGRVVEGASSNVFFVRQGGLVTAPEEAGILPGITRAIVLDAARELGVAVDLRAPAASELASFEETFISSSIRELVPVVRIDDRPVGTGAPGPMYQRLFSRFKEKVAEIQRAEGPLTGALAATVPPPTKT